MRTIYEYSFDVRDLLKGYQPLEWTIYSNVVHSTYDDNTQLVTLWVEHWGHIDDDNQRQFKFMKYYPIAVGTGWEIPAGARHICSVISVTGYVWHIYKAHNIIEATP